MKRYVHCIAGPFLACFIIVLGAAHAAAGAPGDTLDDPSLIKAIKDDFGQRRSTNRWRVDAPGDEGPSLSRGVCPHDGRTLLTLKLPASGGYTDIWNTAYYCPQEKTYWVSHGNGALRGVAAMWYGPFRIGPVAGSPGQDGSGPEGPKDGARVKGDMAERMRGNIKVRKIPGQQHLAPGGIRPIGPGQGQGGPLGGLPATGEMRESMRSGMELRKQPVRMRPGTQPAEDTGEGSSYTVEVDALVGDYTSLDRTVSVPVETAAFSSVSGASLYLEGSAYPGRGVDGEGRDIDMQVVLRATLVDEGGALAMDVPAALFGPLDGGFSEERAFGGRMSATGQRLRFLQDGRAYVELSMTGECPGGCRYVEYSSFSITKATLVIRGER